MPTKTIEWVKDEARTFPTKHGEKASILVGFEGGERAELTTNPDKVDARLASLKALMGKPSEFGLEDKGTFDDGKRKPWKIIDWPGKPQQGFSPNGGRSGKSPEERASIEKQVALKAAVELIASGVTAPPEVPTTAAVFALGLATDFYAWLQDTSGATPSPGEGKRVSKGGADTSSKDSSPPAPESSEVAASTRLGKAGEAAASDSTSGGESGAGRSSPSEDFNEDAPANPEQIERLKELYGGLRSATKTAFDEHKVGKLTDLTQGQAAEMIQKKFGG